MPKQIILTNSKLNALRKELEELKSVKRREIAEKIKNARSFGDLSENSEYDEVKNEQAMIESRIELLEQTLKDAVVLDKSKIKTDVVTLGTVVRVYDKEFNEEIEFRVMSAFDANPEEFIISDESHIGKALMGHRVGDVVYADTPSGQKMEFHILSIDVADLDH